MKTERKNGKKATKATKAVKNVSVKDLTKGVQVSSAKPIDTGKDKDKGKKKGKFTRDKAVVQAIKALKTFTFPALLNKSDKIMVSKGFSSNPTATNVNKYGLVALIAFGVVTQDKAGCISMKNGIKYTLVS